VNAGAAMKLKGRVALITGTSPNICGGIAIGMAEAGALVVCVDVQPDMLLAARGLGLASVLTTRPRRGFEHQIKQKLGIPDNVDTAELIPLGYPAEGRRYGPTNRRPVVEVTFGETWGQRWDGA